MLKIEQFVILIICIFAYLSCISDTQSDCCTTIKQDRNCCITFTANYNNLETKTTSAMAEGVISTIFIYNNHESIYNYYPINKNNTKYVANCFGSLVSTNNKEILLIPNVYDIYSISSNSNIDLSDSINKGVLKNAHNNIDYIWSSIKNLKIRENVEISLTYKRLMSKLSIEIQNNSNNQIEIMSAKILDNKIIGSIDVQTGTIIDNNSNNNDYLDMIVEQMFAYITIAPQCRVSGIDLYIEYLIKEDNEIIKKVSGIIEQPDKKGFEAGKNYLYKALITQDKIQFICSGVEDWILDNSIELEL